MSQYSEHDLKVIELMLKEGGSFVKCLAECFRHADAINYKRLKNAFPEYWREYSVRINKTEEL